MKHTDNTEFVEQYDQNEWVECPQCHSVMVSLSEYEIRSSSEFPAIEGDLLGFLIWGWWIFVYNFVLGLIGFGGRKAQLAKRKKEVLPQFPQSLVCPRCLYVLRRA